MAKYHTLEKYIIVHLMMFWGIESERLTLTVSVLGPNAFHTEPYKTIWQAMCQEQSGDLLKLSEAVQHEKIIIGNTVMNPGLWCRTVWNLILDNFWNEWDQEKFDMSVKMILEG